MDSYKIKIFSTSKNIIFKLSKFEPHLDVDKKCIVISKLDSEALKEIRKYCKKNQLKHEIINTNFERGSSYRRTFFNCNKDINGHYFCAYCGRYIPKEKITVDHIIPISSVKHNKRKQKLLTRFGVENINCDKNLAPSCRACNSKKGSKTGFYIPAGFIGKKQYLWYFRHGIRFTMLSVFIFYIYSLIL